MIVTYMYNSDDATIQVITLTEGQYVAIACILLYVQGRTGHISNFLVKNLIVVLQWGYKGGEGEGEVG